MREIHVSPFCKKLLDSLPCLWIFLICTNSPDLMALAADREDALQGVLHFRQEAGLNAYPDENEDRPEEKDQAYKRLTDK